MMASLGPSWLDPNWLLQRFGSQMLLVSSAIVFVECGLLFPFLPGDSLLFSIGLFIRRDVSGLAGIHVNLALACAVLSLAAFAGNVAGYEIGRALGPALYRRDGRFLRRHHIDRTRAFFDTYGNRALVIGRFVPVVRTYITLVAGVSRLDRRRFFTWSLVGAVLWATSLTLLGYLLGGVSFLQKNIEVVILVIVALSLAPALVEWLRARRSSGVTTR
ncbi:MAG: VTT domain-containing protein [Lapillicoccus sp.]